MIGEHVSTLAQAVSLSQGRDIGVVAYNNTDDNRYKPDIPHSSISGSTAQHRRRMIQEPIITVNHTI